MFTTPLILDATCAVCSTGDGIFVVMPWWVYDLPSLGPGVQSQLGGMHYGGGDKWSTLHKLTLT